jgi:chromosome segregation ATPase
MRKCAFAKTALWTLAAATGLIAAGTFLGFGSHMRTAVKQAYKSVQTNIPPDFEIARLRNEINGLDKDLSGNFDALANETVAVRRLKDNLEEMQARLEKQKTVVLKLRHDLSSGAQKVAYGGVEYTADELRDTLSREFDAYRAAEGAIKAKQEELKARQDGLNLGRAKIDAMRSAKEKMSAELAKIEAEYKRVQVLEARSDFQVDDSRLSGIKKSMKELRDRIQAIELAHTYKAEFNHESIVEKVEQKAKADQVLKEIDAHFGSAKEPARVAADNDDQK